MGSVDAVLLKKDMLAWGVSLCGTSVCSQQAHPHIRMANITRFADLSEHFLFFRKKFQGYIGRLLCHLAVAEPLGRYAQECVQCVLTDTLAPERGDPDVVVVEDLLVAELVANLNEFLDPVMGP